MKAVLSNRIYMEATPEYQEVLDKELTYAIPSRDPNAPPEIMKTMAPIRKGLVTIPIGRVDLIPEDYEIVDRRVMLPVELPEFRGTLRESQQLVFERVEDNCIINALPGWGKTFTALQIARKLGQKTLIVLHTIPLRNQWAREIKKVFGFEPGIIGSGKFNISSDIVVGNVQTLYRNVAQIQKEFGTVILDEMHHVSSKTFSTVIDTNHARYKIGLSGTIERKDGKHVVFRDYFGNTVYKPPKENTMTPIVDIVRPDPPIRFMDGAHIPWANRVNNLVQQENYIHLVSMLAAAYAAKGHKVLVVSDRVHFLKTCANLVGDIAICLTGEVHHEDREDLINQLRHGEKKVLFGTQAIFSEGISVDNLSCLILGTPINNEPLLKQIIGRVIREHPGKLTPRVVDIHLTGNTARSQASNRMGYYMKEGYVIRQL